WGSRGRGPGRVTRPGPAVAQARTAQRGGWRGLPRHAEAGAPAGRAPVLGRADAARGDPGRGEQPGDHRVRVPALARPQLVAAPDRRRHRPGERGDATDPPRLLT